MVKKPIAMPRDTEALLGVAIDITVRKQALDELERHRLHLEELVAERTTELEARVTDVRRLNRAMTNLLEDLQASNQRLEQTRARLQDANRELNDFAYVVSHDLKAPLRGITQLSNWIREDYASALDSDGQEMLELLVGRAKRMHDLIEGILQYSRVGRLRQREREIDLNEMVLDIVDLLAAPPHIKIDMITELPTVVGEEIRFRQVFQNLLSNAIKFMDKPQGRVTIACENQKTAWQFSVSDNGPGIAEKYYDKVFQIFQTLRPRDEYESTGVGLALVKKIVEAWGGRVWLDSTVGEGSTFYFTLPKQ
jgi:light-regulated signal transduction histidine kinase (bacteriophytochrome)